MPDINDPPWVVEIDGVKFATPEAVVILLQSVSEERDALEAVVGAARYAKRFADGESGVYLTVMQQLLNRAFTALEAQDAE